MLNVSTTTVDFAKERKLYAKHFKWLLATIVIVVVTEEFSAKFSFSNWKRPLQPSTIVLEIDITCSAQVKRDFKFILLPHKVMKFFLVSLTSCGRSNLWTDGPKIRRGQFYLQFCQIELITFWFYYWIERLETSLSFVDLPLVLVFKKNYFLIQEIRFFMNWIFAR